MRLFLLFLLIAQTSFSQTSVEQEESVALLDSLIQGEWYLSETEITEPRNYSSDSSQFTLNQQMDPKLEFNNDSLKIYPDASNQLFGNGIRGYEYLVQENASLASHSIFVSTGRKRSPQLLESYEVIKCTGDELVLRSLQSINKAQDVIDLTVIYTYQRKNNM